MKSTSAEIKETKALWGATLIDQVDSTRYSSLAKLCGVVGYVRRAVMNWLACTVRQFKTAFQDQCLAAQRGVKFPVTTLNRLVAIRVQAIARGEAGVPLVPYNTWISTLLTREAHDANHEGVAGTLLRVRSKAWVVQGPRIARNIIDSCMHCYKAKANW